MQIIHLGGLDEHVSFRKLKGGSSVGSPAWPMNNHVLCLGIGGWEDGGEFCEHFLCTSLALC